MGTVLFAAPSIERFHLHELLARRLLREGHQVRILTPDPVVQLFYSTQGMPTRLLQRSRTPCRHPRVPLDEFAMQDCRLAGSRQPGLVGLGRASRRLGGYVDPLLRYFTTELPDLVFLHQGRCGLHRLVHFLGREFGCQVLHTGDGLIPGTMQWDEEGLDGDASSCRRGAADYREMAHNEPFLGAALAAMLGEAKAPPLARRRLQTPDLLDRCGLSLQALLSGQVQEALHALNAHRLAEPRAGTTEAEASPFPASPPFAVALLQSRREPRVRLDSNCPDGPGALLAGTRRALERIEPGGLPLLAVAPPEVAASLRSLPPDTTLCPPEHALLALGMATATVTINHPWGLASLMTATPLVHLGRSPYGLRGVTVAGSLATLEQDLQRAIALDEPDLRARMLTRVLAFDHVWCDPEHPDGNGIRGLQQEIDQRLERQHTPRGRSVAYRAGPSWPLAVARPPGRAAP